jgi:tetratricopeptide (TPR) repeat protein
METRSLSEAVKLIMQGRSWTQVRLGAELGKDQAFVSTVISGKRDPRLSTVIQLMERVGWEVRFAPKREELDPVKRREFVTAAASVAFLPSSTGQPFRDPAYLRELAVRIEHDEREHGGIAGVATTMRHISRIQQVAEGRDSRLQAAASDVASSAVWTLADAGRFDLGDSVGRFALELAQRSGDADAQSRALSALTKIQVDRGDAGEAVRYALQALRLREVPDVQRNYLTLRLGEALSITPGQERAARDVIDGLRVTLADTEPQAPLEVAAQMGTVGDVLYGLGAYREALACADESMQLGPSLKSTGLNLARQAKVALRIRQPDLAADQMRILTRVVPLVHSAKLNGHLKEVLALALSAQWRTAPELQEARRQLQSVMPEPPRSKQ